MIEFKFEELFEPSRQTKEWWLSTHKTAESYAGVPLPGLFRTTHYEWQVAGFFSIFVLEGIATYWSWNEGVAITAILVSIFVDLAFAIFSHIPQKDICRLRNQLVFEVAEKAKAIRKRVDRKQLFVRLFQFLIVVSALFKFLWFYLVYLRIDSTAMFVFTCYMLGAVLHITCTGYAVFTFIFNWKLRSEYSEYIDSNGDAHSFDPNKPLPLLIESDVQLLPVEVGRHQLVRRDDNKLYLLTRGVLTDDQLSEMIGRQLTPEQKRTVAIEGVRQQCSILQQSPMRLKAVESSKAATASS